MIQRRRWPSHSLVLAAAIVGGCSMLSARQPDPLEESYRFVHRFYLKPVQADLITQAGLDRLTTLDHDIAIEVSNRELLIKHGSKRIAEFHAPAPDDWRGWGKVAAQAVTAAAAASPHIAKMSKDDLENAVIAGAVATLDPHSQYLAPKAASENVLRESEHTALDTGDDQAQHSGIGTNLPGGRHPVPSSHQVPSSVSLRIDDRIAVIQIRRFTTITGRLVHQALERSFTEKAQPRGVVLDLRNDPGGMIDAAVEVADIFLDRGSVVVLEGREPRDRRVFNVKPDGSIYERIPLAVLVNGETVSAAEVLAAALQDNRRASVIGTATFGKGTSQRIISLTNGGELWLTSAYMRSAAGYLLDGHGVVPDVCTKLASNASADPARAALAERFRSLAAERRVALSDAEWAELRQLCPPSQRRSAGDLERAKQVLREDAPP